MLNTSIRLLHQRFDPAWVSKHLLNLYHLERRQTFPAWNASARYTCDLLKAEGFDAELLEFPADGVTTYQDKCMPIGWDTTKMRLTVLTPIAGLSDPVVSDYDREPLMAVKGSVSTPPEGLTARLITESQMKAGEDVRGAFVLLDPSTRPRMDNMRMLLDLGAVGWVSDFLENPNTTPDSVAWINAGTENNSWHVQAEDRDFISYQITPRTGFALRKACESGTVIVRGESDGHRYVSTLPAVTALLSGESPREIWMVGHLYEPLIDDNSNGVIGAIAILKALRDMAEANEIRLKYSVRVVFASEMYGFAAVADHFGGRLTEHTLGGINMDGITGSTDKSVYHEFRAFEAVDYRGESQPAGFAGNILLSAVSKQFHKDFPQSVILPHDHACGDDTFLGDATIGLPVVWIFHGSRGFHHNSAQDERAFDLQNLIIHLSYCGAWVCAMATLTDDDIAMLLPDALAHAQDVLNAAARDVLRPGTNALARLRFLYDREYGKIAALRQWSDFPAISETLQALRLPDPKPVYRETPVAPERPFYAAVPHKSWYEYADDFVFTRRGCGFPHDLVRFPFKERRTMPGTILYDALSDIFCRMDVKKSLQTVLSEVEWDKNLYFDESTIRTYLYTCTMLADGGYLGMDCHPLTTSDLTAALHAAGVHEGDTLLVHSSLSGLGYIEGGAQTVIDALRMAVGATGTFLAPAFARPYIMFEGTLNKSYRYRPYDTRPDGALHDATISTGALPKAMLKCPDAHRSGHSTHEWVAIGAKAADCVAGHGLLDPPAGSSSPMHTALKRDGSIVFLGCSIASNTFLHYIEDQSNAPFLQPAVIRYIDAKGETHTALIEHHLPGHRNFYGDPAASDFYAEAVRRGLTIDAVPCGMGTIYRMALSDLYKIGIVMFKDDPLATLCKNPDCPFCAAFQTNKN